MTDDAFSDDGPETYILAENLRLGLQANDDTAAITFSFKSGPVERHYMLPMGAKDLEELQSIQALLEALLRHMQDAGHDS